jgi:hypothetical protein
MKPGMAEHREGFKFSQIALMVLITVLCLLGTWVLTHSYVMVFLTVVASLGVLVILAPGDTLRLKLSAYGISSKIERKSSRHRL